MARPIYSSSFIVQAGLAGHSPDVIVPDNHVHVVKQLTAYANPIVGVTSVFFQDALTGAALWSAFFNVDAGGSVFFYGALVFGPGSRYRFYVNAAENNGADVYAGGYDLINTSS